MVNQVYIWLTFYIGYIKRRQTEGEFYSGTVDDILNDIPFLIICYFYSVLLKEISLNKARTHMLFDIIFGYLYG